MDHTFFREAVQTRSVITLTVGVNVDAHDCRAPTLRRIATRAVARLCKPTASKGCSLRCIRSVAVDESTEAQDRLSTASVDGEGPSMSYDMRNVLRPWLRHGHMIALALVAAAIAACSGDGDGSVGIGTGQDPDPVAPDFPIAYTKGPLNDADDDL